MIGDVWYRYYDSLAYNKPKLILIECKVVRETEASVWVVELPDYGAPPKRVLKYARKRWAAPTEDEAKKSFIRRKQLQISWLERKLDAVRDCLAMAKGGETVEQRRKRLDPLGFG